MTDREDVREAVAAAVAAMPVIQGTALRIFGRYDRDQALLWFLEELGELVAALRKGKSEAEVQGELADVLVWALCLTNILQKDAASVLEHAFSKEIERQERVYGRLKYWESFGE